MIIFLGKNRETQHRAVELCIHGTSNREQAFRQIVVAMHIYMIHNVSAHIPLVIDFNNGAMPLELAETMFTPALGRRIHLETNGAGRRFKTVHLSRAAL